LIYSRLCVLKSRGTFPILVREQLHERDVVKKEGIEGWNTAAFEGEERACEFGNVGTL
jgi:hypothetical protein